MLICHVTLCSEELAKVNGAKEGQEEEKEAMDVNPKYDSISEKFYKKKKTEQEKSSEFKAFRALKVLLESKNSDGIDWWRKFEATFPILARLARRYLSIPASSAPSERIFSKYTTIWEKKKCNLKPETANDIIYLHETRRNRANED